jgi:hypothetical protein
VREGTRKFLGATVAQQAENVGGTDDNAATRELLALAQETARKTGSPVILVIPPHANSYGMVIDGKFTDQKEESTDDTATELLRELIKNQKKHTELLRKIAVRLDKDSKDRKKDTADGIQEGLLKAEALSQPSRQKKIREMQEDMLSQLGHNPAGIARLHNHGAEDNVIRKAAQKISNEHNRRKKKKSK